MSLVNALSAASVKEASINLCRSGICAIPLLGKQAAVNWKLYQSRVMPEMALTYWFNRAQWLNVGIVLGNVSGGLVCVDCDGLEAAALFIATFPQLQNTLTVKTGSRKGYHFYYTAGTLPRTTRALNLREGNIELRSSGTYVVAPPSLHPDTGARYEISNPVAVMHMSNLDAVVGWLEGLKPGRAGQGAASKPVMRARGNTPSMFYAKAALSSAVVTVERSGEGNRNNTLYRQALSLGNFVPDGLLSEHEIETALLSAARTAGQGEGEALRTIRSGVQNGKRYPRSGR